MNNDKNNINWKKYNLNKEKAHNNDLNKIVFKYKRADCNNLKRINSPIFYRNNTSSSINNKDSNRRLSSPFTYTYTFQRNNNK